MDRCDSRFNTAEEGASERGDSPGHTRMSQGRDTRSPCLSTSTSKWKRDFEASKNIRCPRTCLTESYTASMRTENRVARLRNAGNGDESCPRWTVPHCEGAGPLRTPGGLVSVSVGTVTSWLRKVRGDTGPGRALPHPVPGEEAGVAAWSAGLVCGDRHMAQDRDPSHRPTRDWGEDPEPRGADGPRENGGPTSWERTWRSTHTVPKIKVEWVPRPEGGGETPSFRRE